MLDGGAAPRAHRLVTAGNFSLDDTVGPWATGTSEPGGDALFSALGAAAWGYPTAIITRIGEDYPQYLLDQIASLGIELNTLSRVQGPTLHYRIVNGRDNSRKYVHLTDPTRLSELCPQGEDLERLCGAGWVHIAAMPIERQAAIVEAARTNGIPYSLDPHEEYVVGFEPQLTRMLEGAVFAPSLVELQLLFPDLATAPVETLVRVGAGRALSFGALAVAFKLGAEGSYVANADHAFRVPALPVDPVDTTGAGDAYCGGFLAGYLATGSLLAAGIAGSVVGAYVVAHLGAPTHVRPAASWLVQSSSELAGAMPYEEAIEAATLLGHWLSSQCRETTPA